MTEAELVALARAQKNPFLGSVHRNGLEEPRNDVPEIHAAARARLRKLVDEVRQSGQLAFQVVTGEPGDGKTHLLAKLRADAERSWQQSPGAESAIVPIEPLRDPEAPFGHILRAMFGGLSHPLAMVPPGSDSPATPLEFLIFRILRRVTLALADAGHEACADVAARLRGSLDRFPGTIAMLLRESWPTLGPVLERDAQRLPDFGPKRVDVEVWRALCRFPKDGALVTNWLRGYDGELAPLDDEDRAFLAISTFLHLSEVPIVLGFDQLEGVERLGEDAVVRLLQALGDQLYGAGGRALVLFFCQAVVWADFRKKLQAQTRDRLLQAPELHLGAVPAELSTRLVESRLASMWSGLALSPPHATFPYPPGYVRATIEEKSLRGPRRVLSYFAEAGFTEERPAEKAPRPPREIARAEYDRLRAEAAAKEIAPDDRATFAQSALTELLTRAQGKRLGDAHVVRASRAKAGRGGATGLEAKLARGGQEATVYAEASNKVHGMAAKAVAKRLEESLKKADRAVLLRDEKIPLPPTAKKILDDLREKATVVHVRDDESVSFAAAERLLNAAAAGDIDVSVEDAAAVLLEEIAPTLDVVRRFLDAALGTPAAAAPALDHQAIVVAAIAKPPFVASEAQLARAHGVTVEQIAAGSDELERKGEATVLRGKDGGRAVLRRPR